MNTIPTTFRRPRVTYTILGGMPPPKIGKYTHRLTVLILNRGGHLYRGNLLNEIKDYRGIEIISVEGPTQVYDVEELSRKYSNAKFLLLKQKITTGEKLNLGINEAYSPLILVIWSDMKIPPSSISDSIINKIEQSNTLCTVPLLRNPRTGTIPSIQVPGLIKKRLKVVPWNPMNDGMRSFFPFDFCGIYKKDKFILTGGFDHTIDNPHWQKLDFGLRSYLWGEEIICNTSLLIQYRSDVKLEDSTPDEGYKIFYLKNLAVEFKRDMGILPLHRILPYIISSNTGPFSSVKEYLAVRKWVKLNKYRFKQDARSLIELWQVPE